MKHLPMYILVAFVGGVEVEPIKREVSKVVYTWRNKNRLVAFIAKTCFKKRKKEKKTDYCISEK